MTEADKAWIMVEDELLSTAGTFTRGLHIAEYKRLKSLAQRKQGDALNNIARPVDTKTQMSAGVRLRKAQEAQAARTTKGVEKLKVPSGRKRKSEGDLSSDSESDTLIGDRNLAGLMHGDDTKKKDRQKLDGLIGSSQPNTRAAAGYGSQVSPRKPIRTTTQRPTVESPNCPTSEEEDEEHYKPRRQLTNLADHRSSRAEDLTSQSPRGNLDSSPARHPPKSDSRKEDQQDDESDSDWRRPIATRRPLKIKREPVEDDMNTRQSIKLEEIPYFLG